MSARTTAPVVHHSQFKLAVTCLVLAVLVIPIEATFLVGLHEHTPREKVVTLATILVFMLMAGTGVRLAVECRWQPR